MIWAESMHADYVSSPMVTLLWPLSFFSTRVIAQSGRHAHSTSWKGAKNYFGCCACCGNACLFTEHIYISTSLFGVCVRAWACARLCLCTSMPGIVFTSVYLGESTDTVTMELILLGMRLGSCCNTLAVVLLFWSVPWSFLLQRDSWPSNMIQTTNYPLTTSQPSQSPGQGL